MACETRFYLGTVFDLGLDLLFCWAILVLATQGHNKIIKTNQKS